MADSYQALSQIFQMPPKKHHLKMIALIIIICACAIFLGYYFVYYENTGKSDILPPVVTDQTLIIKDQMIKQLNAATSTAVQYSKEIDAMIAKLRNTGTSTKQKK